MGRILGLAALLLLAAGPALAHPGHADSGFTAGFGHPLLGLDHLLAMIGVGLWAALSRGRAVWIWPAAFAGSMLGGFLLARAGIALPGVEPAILASVFALGFAVALHWRPPTALAAALVALLGAAHGMAHGLEAAGDVAGFTAGMTLATALLHLAGVALVLTASRAGAALPARAMGVGMIAGGLALSLTG